MVSVSFPQDGSVWTSATGLRYWAEEKTASVRRMLTAPDDGVAENSDGALWQIALGIDLTARARHPVPRLWPQGIGSSGSHRLILLDGYRTFQRLECREGHCPE